MAIEQSPATFASVGKYLEFLTWPEAGRLLSPERVVVIPIGAQSKEHGYHLPLNTDFLLAQYLAHRLVQVVDVLVAPTVPYGYYPAFVEYPGSVSLDRDVFQRTVGDICRSLGRFGATRFYALNTGISTNWALEPLRLDIAKEGIVFDYCDLMTIVEDVEQKVAQQPCGSHADEIETSMMMYIRPEVVHAGVAVPETGERRGSGRLTRDVSVTTGIYSPSGSWGDPTLYSCA